MSSSQMEEITCPKCGEKSPYRIWRSINTTLDPDMKQAVRDGSAFLFTCPYCKKTTHVEYGFLYHQMEDQIMIQVVSADEDVGAAIALLNDVRLADMKKEFNLDDHYLNRIVVTQNRLREKIAILDSGLDDRIVEIYKLFLLVKYQEKHPDAKNVELFFYQGSDDDRCIEAIVDGKSAGAFEFSNETYARISESYKPMLKDIRDDEPVIDREWAIRFLGARNKSKGSAIETDE